MGKARSKKRKAAKKVKPIVLNNSDATATPYRIVAPVPTSTDAMNTTYGCAEEPFGLGLEQTAKSLQAMIAAQKAKPKSTWNKIKHWLGFN